MATFKYTPTESLSMRERQALRREITKAATTGLTEWAQKTYPDMGVEVKLLDMSNEVQLRFPTPTGPEYFEVIVKWRV